MSHPSLSLIVEVKARHEEALGIATFANEEGLFAQNLTLQRAEAAATRPVIDFDGASGLKINGDFYRLRVADSTTTRLPPGTDVIFKEFDGTTAIVTLASASASSQEQ